MIIASRVLKTRDSIETRVFKTRFTRFADSLTWKIFATWRFQTPLLIPSLSVFQTLSQSLKHSVSLSSTLNLWSTLSQSLKHSRSEALSLAVKCSPSTASNAQTTFRRSAHPSLEISQTVAVKRLPSNVHRPRRATKLPSPSNAIPFAQTTFRQSPFLRPHSDVPTNGSSDFALFEGMCF